MSQQGEQDSEQHKPMWDSIMGGSEEHVAAALSELKPSQTYIATMRIRIQAGKIYEAARTIEATQARFFRQQPGCISYCVGICKNRPNTLMITAVWSSRQLYNSLPKNREDLNKLSDARAPAYALFEAGERQPSIEFVDSAVTYGLHQDESNFTHFPRWDTAMANIDNPHTIPLSNLYMLHGTIKIKEGKAVEFVKGMEVTACKYYRKLQGVHLYCFGISSINPDIVVFAHVFASKELFDSLPENKEDLQKLERARAPYMALLDDSGGESMTFFDSSNVVGNPH